MNSCIVYLVSRLDGYNATLSTGESRFIMTQCSIKNITEHLKLPIIIFHEDYTEKEKDIIKKIYADITFEKIDLLREDLPFKQKPCKTSGLSNGKCSCDRSDSKNPKRLCFRPKGYLMMCRFFSGQLQKHPALQNYDSYFRFDDDSFLLEPFLDQSTFMNQVMPCEYVFRSIFREGQDQSELFTFTKDFCKENNLPIEKYIEVNRNSFLFTNGKYNGMAPYNNFHYCKLSLWNNPVIKKYIEAIENVNGCLNKNWMDANIHAMIIFILMPLLGLSCKPICNFGYRHNRHFSILNRVHITYDSSADFFPKNKSTK